MFLSVPLIKEICRKNQIKLNRKRGQNFLINQKILKQIVDLAEIKKNDIILEIGTGFGNLTYYLIQKAKKVISLEIDKKLFSIAKEFLKNKKNLILVNQDILEFRPQKYNLKNYKIVANLPYKIASQVLFKFLKEEENKPKLLVIMIQKEVAQKIFSKNKKTNLLNLLIEFYAQIKVIQYVSKANFYPRPKVDSAILKIKTKSKSEIRKYKVNEKKFFDFLKISFKHPRKTLINNLKKHFKFDKIKRAFSKLNLKLTLRPEQLSLNQFLKLFKELNL